MEHSVYDCTLRPMKVVMPKAVLDLGRKLCVCVACSYDAICLTTVVVPMAIPIH